MNKNLELSIIFPCLNEELTLGECLEEANRFLKENGINGEIIVADNGSTDRSIEIAEQAGARVVKVPEKGYGSALFNGIMASNATYGIMGDADMSYDMYNLSGLLNELRNGNLSLIWPGFIGGFIVAMITIFKKEWSPVTVPVYAVLEGLALGGISSVYAEAFSSESNYGDIVQQAIFLTFGIFFTLLFAYKTKVIKPTENFKLMVFSATMGIGLLYLISIMMNLFGGAGISLIHSNGLAGIGFSLFVVAIAALNLVLDFDFIEEGAEKGAPKYMEWYGAFGLLVTLIWLYLEILRLLAKLNSRK